MSDPNPTTFPPDMVRAAVLVTTEELAELLAAAPPARPVLLDVRWALGRTDGAEQHRAGHVPGAVYVDLDTELAAPATPADGRHPVPPLAALQAAARRWGVRHGTPVVAYDAVGGMSAARAWWLLRWAGVEDVRLLDGGLDAWAASGGVLEQGDVVPVPGDVVLRAGGLPTLTADQAAALAARGTLLDARAGERYRGEVEPVDPRAGHVPAAVSAPTAGNLDPDGRFLPADVLRDRFAALGLHAGDPGDADAAPSVGVYCGSGVTAAHEVAALASVGITASLYPGSWSQWSNDPDRPVATGPEPA
jgi:thiosulfate/3-mercaptopyruvate sulfurtransferase